MRPETVEELEHVDYRGRWLEGSEFDEDSEHDDRGRHTSSLFDGGMLLQNVVPIVSNISTICSR